MSRQKTQQLGGLFSLYIYIETFKPCQKSLDLCQYNLAEMFLWWPSTKIVQALMSCKKNMAARGRAYFPYMSI